MQRGVSDTQLRGRRYQRLFHGTYVDGAAAPGLSEWVTAARLVLPEGSRPAGRTAFQLLGVDAGPTFPVVFATPGPFETRRQGLRTVRRPDWPGDLRDAWGEVCRMDDLLTAVQIGDRAIHRGVLAPAFFSAMSELSGGTREASLLVRPGSESWRETWMRLCLVLAGLPEPRLNVWIMDGDRRVARVDGLYEEAKVITEYDGEQHRTSDQQYRRDVERLEDLHRLGYLDVRATRTDLTAPWGFVERVASALTARGVPVRPRRSPLWISTMCL